ncbi:hypothetical protein O0L34_g12261 [Tuta absoluta]|nr:hypothetical protein O0L34_g12261 [Tuta absoluta]
MAQLEVLILSIPATDNLVIIGDTNLDILHNKTNPHTTKYRNTLCGYGLQCTIPSSEVTREAIVDGRHETSCLDHVWVRARRSHLASSYVLEMHASDHHALATLLSDGATGGGGPRHVTPLRVGPSPNRATQRHTLIQKRLEEAVVRGCGGAGARRVLELVCERVAAGALTNCTRLLALHRHKVTTCDTSGIRNLGGDIRKQLEAALGALVSERGGRAALCALAERAVRAKLARHTREPGELCDAASAALRTLVSTSWSEETPTAPASVPQSPTILTKRETDQHKLPQSPTFGTIREKDQSKMPQSPTALTKPVPQSPTFVTNRETEHSKVSQTPTLVTKREAEHSKVLQTPTSVTKLEKEQSKVPSKQDTNLATALLDLKECICLIIEGSTPSNSILCSTLAAVELSGASSARGVKRAAVQLSQELCVALGKSSSSSFFLCCTLAAVELSGASSARGVKRAAVQLSQELCVALGKSSSSSFFLCCTLAAVELSGASSARGVKRAAVQLSQELCVALGKSSSSSFFLCCTLAAVELSGASSARGVKRAAVQLSQELCVALGKSSSSSFFLCCTLAAVELSGASSARGVKRAAVQLSQELCVALGKSSSSSFFLCCTLAAVELSGASSARGVKRAAVQLSQELCVALVCWKPSALTESILRAVERVWSACIPRLDPPDSAQGGSRAPTPPSEDEGLARPPPDIVIVAPTVVGSDKGVESEQDELTDTFARLVSPRVVRQVSRHEAASWRALRRLVLWATDRGWLCPNRLTESCVALYRRDWPQEVLSPLSAWLRDVSAAIAQPQLALFLGFLGEYCDDLVVPDD